MANIHENRLSREREKRRLLKAQKEQEAAKAEMDAKLAAIKAEDEVNQQRATAAATSFSSLSSASSSSTVTENSSDTKPVSMESLFGADTPPPNSEGTANNEQDIGPSPAKRSRRSRGAPVDYVALAAKLEAEQRGTGDEVSK